MGGGFPLVGFGHLGGAAPRAGSPPPSFIYGGGGTPWNTQYSDNRVRCPRTPFSTSFIFSESLGKALPESLHHHRRHAVVLTELIFFPDVLLDQEGGDRHRVACV
jgi:hypothetical protein